MISGQAPNTATQTDCQQYTDFASSGMTPDGQAIGTGCVFPANVKTIADQLVAAGFTWKAYMEDMGNDPARETATCGHAALAAKDPTAHAEAPMASLPTGDQYAAKHDPFVYFHSIIDAPICQTSVVNLKALSADLMSVSTTPNFTFIAPNLCNDATTVMMLRAKTVSPADSSRRTDSCRHGCRRSKTRPPIRRTAC